MTTSDLVLGRITSFRREQGFGLITLEDGTPVKFDAGICANMQNPEEGAAVRLRVGPAKWGGGLKALYVEPVDVPSFLDAPGPRSLEDQLAAVQREHLVNGLSEHLVDELVAQRFGGRPEAGTILELLDAYYTGDPARARSDGYLRRGAGPLPEAGDVLAELAALLPDASLPRQIPADVASLDDVIELANAALRRASDGRRVYRLETGGGWHAYLALASDRALRLASALPFSPAPADVA